MIEKRKRLEIPGRFLSTPAKRWKQGTAESDAVAYWLTPGLYTSFVSIASGSAGKALLEVFEAP
jgi:hypothetical protein